MMDYQGALLKDEITVGTLYTIHYFEYMSSFSFEGESHDFWEFIYVDKGDVLVTAGSRHLRLKKGEAAFHAPNEFHDVRATGDSAPNLVVVSFACDSPAMEYFRKTVLTINDTERDLLANVISEARRCFDCRLDNPYQKTMPRKTATAFGSEQLIRLYLEHFLISLARRSFFSTGSEPKLSPKNQKPIKSRNDLEIYRRVTKYMEDNLGTHLTIEKICRDNLASRSQLQKIFHQQCQMGIIEYFSWLKIRYAQELIRTQRMNFTQISDALGYSSIHYFSRQFKKVSGMTPSEYASSVKAMSDGKYRDS